MNRTMNDTTDGILVAGGPGAGRCLWDESVCTDTPTHFVTFEEADGASADMFCVRHYVLTLARLCQIHLPDCAGDFAGHVAAHGEL
jgi:uncharacterized protein YPO0396